MNSLKNAIVLLIGTLIMFVLRWPNQNNNEPNIDTSTWLTSLITIEKSENTFWTFLNYTDSRPLTVFPLWVASQLGVHVNYQKAEMVGMVCWILSCFFLWLTLKKTAVSTLYASIISSGLLLSFSSIYDYDYVGYSSEAPSVLMLTIALYWAISLLKTKMTHASLLGFGLWLGLLLYAKFQIIPMGIIIALFISWQLIKDKNLIGFGLFVLGGLLPTILVNLYFYAHGQFQRFWDYYFWYYFYYSFTNEYSQLTFLERFSPIRAAKLFLYSPDLRIFFAGFGALAIFLIYQNWKNLKKWPIEFWLILIFSAVSLYSILQSGNTFQHYVLLFPVPLMLIVGTLKPNKWSIQVAILITIIQLSLNLIQRQPIKPLFTKSIDEKITAAIKANSNANDRMVIWGYADRFHVYTGLPMGYRWSYTITIYATLPELQGPRLKDFMNDMELHKPQIFMDTNGSTLQITGNLSQRHENFSEVAKFVQKHFQFVADIEGVRIYKRL